MNKSRIWQYLCIVAVLVLGGAACCSTEILQPYLAGGEGGPILPQFVYSLPLQGDYRILSIR